MILGDYMVHGKSQMQGFEKTYVGRLFSEYLIQPFFLLKMPQIDQPGSRDFYHLDKQSMIWGALDGP